MGTKNLNSAADLITFTRASGGTALRKISYGSELVTNGTFDSNISGWTKVSSNLTLSHSTDSLSVVSTGTTSNFDNLDGSYSSTIAEGSLIQVKVKLKSINTFPGTALSFYVSGGTLVTLANTTDEQVFQVLNRDTNFIRFVVRGTTDVTIDNVSVKEVTFDQPDGTLQLFNSPANVPRIEYNADGTVKGLLIEEARTNLLTYSEDFSNGAWIKGNTTVVSDVTSAPNGEDTADLVYPTTSGSYRSLRGLGGSVQAGTITVSVWLKYAGFRYINALSDTSSASTDFKIDLVN